MWWDAIFANAWLRDSAALFVTFAVALFWLRLNDSLARRGFLPREMTRKLIHIGTGPLFVLCWLLYSDGAQSRWLAALVPATITLQFILIGLGLVQDEGAVQAMSRSGDRRELLRGPMQYGAIFVIATLVFWRHSPVGIVVLMILCGGDGLADVIGRRYGRAKLSVNPHKSWAGSITMFLASLAFSLAYLLLLDRWGVFSISLAGSFLPLSIIALAATVVEAVSGPDMDNITITVAALGMAWLLTDATGLWRVAFLG